MKAKSNNKITAILIALAIALLPAAACLCFYAAAAGDSYYICYESDDYRVRPATNALKNEGGAYTVSPVLSQGDRFMISDGAGTMYGGERGEPITVREAGTHRYTVTFDPSASGAKIEYAPYTPQDVELVVRAASDTVHKMNYIRANAVFEEYAVQVSLAVGDSVFVQSGGVYYGLTLSGAAVADVDGFTATMAGEYRFAFTMDEDHLYDDEKYINTSDVPELYVLCEANGFTQNADYKMERDEDVIAYAEYTYSSIAVPEKDYELSYAVYDATDGKTYRPSENGKITVGDKGNYDVKYSPTHAYSFGSDKEYNTALERTKEYYGGYYVLGDFNGYEFVDDDRFEESYRLVKDESVTDYDEYRIDLTVTRDMLDDFSGNVEFYITDGTHIYRKPTGADISIDRTGEYELYFSPTHNYGRGYRYRYDRVADEIVGRTVKISDEAEYNEFAKNCVSPEYTLNATVLITRDLDFTGKSFTPIRIFAGELDGLYNTVKGINIDNGDNSACLIQEVTADGSVARLDIDCTLKGGDYVAPVAYNRGRISEVNVSGSVSGNSYCAGVVASALGGGKVENCTSSATVEGILNVGGIAGFNAGEVRDCKNVGGVNNRVFGTSDARKMLNAGGIAGYSTGELFSCENRGDVGVMQARYFGGVCGLASGGVYFCCNYGAVGAENYAGGIIGYYGRFDSNNDNNPLYEYLHGTDLEKWLDEYFGTGDGNFEEAEDSGVREVYYCQNEGAVTAQNHAGGIVGRADAGGLKLVACVSSGDVTAKSSHAGGIGGSFGASTVGSCAAYGTVVANSGSYAGGIAGESSGTIEYCASSAYVEAKDSYIGGIAGAGNVIRNCVAHAFITKGGGSHFGAIAGECGVRSNNFYPTGTANDVKGIDGADYGAESDYGACALDAADIVSQGMLSPELYGLDAEYWLAGETEPRYPVPRAFTDAVKPEQCTETARFDSCFAAADGMRATANNVGKQNVAVTFYEWDFSAEQYDKYRLYYIPSGGNIVAPSVPEEDGYFTWWESDELSDVTADTAVYMRYDKYVTALASDDGMRPLVIVTGRFYSDTELKLAYVGDYIAVEFLRGGESFEYDGPIGVRYRADGDVVIKIILGGEIKSAETKIEGGYAVFTLPQGAQFAVEQNDGNSAALIIGLCIASTALIVAAAFMIPIVAVRLKNNGRKKQDRSDDA